MAETETETRFMGVRVPAELDAAITKQAERLTVPKSAIIRWALTDWLSRQGDWQRRIQGPQETTQHVEA